MLLRSVKARLVILPFAVLFLLFSASPAAAPDCHIESLAQSPNISVLPHSHAVQSHDHSHQLTSPAVSTSQETVVSAGSGINNEICFVVGFIVLLLLRFLHLKRPTFLVKQISQMRFLLPELQSKNLSYLNLNHLQLGIIRI
jgi:hypothetical protein